MHARSRELGGASPPWDGPLSRRPPNDYAVPSFSCSIRAEHGYKETPGRHRKPEDDAARPRDQALNHPNHSLHDPTEACGEGPAPRCPRPAVAGQAHGSAATAAARPKVYVSQSDFLKFTSVSALGSFNDPSDNFLDISPELDDYKRKDFSSISRIIQICYI